MRKDQVLIKTAGHSKGNMIFSCEQNRCGGIKDGIAIRFKKENGCWVLDFSDFEKAYLLAKELRSK